MLEFLVHKKTGTYPDLSESYNYWAGKKFALYNKTLQHWYNNMDGLAGYLAVLACEFGSMLEQDWPYDAKNWKQKKDPRCKRVNGKYTTNCFTGEPPLNAKTAPWKMTPVIVERNKIGEFILKEEKPVVFNLLWCGKAVDHTTGVFRMPATQELKKCQGHVVLLVGYDKTARVFTFRNSWGPDWGNKGYGTLPEEYVNKHCESCSSLPYLPTYPKEVRDFLKIVSNGISGKLID